MALHIATDSARRADAFQHDADTAVPHSARSRASSARGPSGADGVSLVPSTPVLDSPMGDHAEQSNFVDTAFRRMSLCEDLFDLPLYGGAANASWGAADKGPRFSENVPEFDLPEVAAPDAADAARLEAMLLARVDGGFGAGVGSDLLAAPSPWPSLGMMDAGASAAKPDDGYPWELDLLQQPSPFPTRRRPSAVHLVRTAQMGAAVADSPYGAYQHHHPRAGGGAFSNVGVDLADVQGGPAFSQLSCAADLGEFAAGDGFAALETDEDHAAASAAASGDDGGGAMFPPVDAAGAPYEAAHVSPHLPAAAMEVPPAPPPFERGRRPKPLMRMGARSMTWSGEPATPPGAKAESLASRRQLRRPRAYTRQPPTASEDEDEDDDESGDSYGRYGGDDDTDAGDDDGSGAYRPRMSGGKTGRPGSTDNLGYFSLSRGATPTGTRSPSVLKGSGGARHHPYARPPSGLLTPPPSASPRSSSVGLDYGDDDENEDEEEGSDAYVSSTRGQKLSHNEMERRRRSDLRREFQRLRSLVPSLSGERAPKIVILQEVNTYIDSLHEQMEQSTNGLARLRAERDGLLKQMHQRHHAVPL